jgi:hypothetical protein
VNTGRRDDELQRPGQFDEYPHSSMIRNYIVTSRHERASQQGATRQ